MGHREGFSCKSISGPHCYHGFATVSYFFFCPCMIDDSSLSGGGGTPVNRIIYVDVTYNVIVYKK